MANKDSLALYGVLHMTWHDEEKVSIKECKKILEALKRKRFQNGSSSCAMCHTRDEKTMPWRRSFLVG